MRPERRAGRIGQAKAHGPYSVRDRKSLVGFELGVVFKNHCGSCVDTGLWRAAQIGDAGGQDRAGGVCVWGGLLGSWYLGMLIGSMTIRTPDR